MQKSRQFSFIALGILLAMTSIIVGDGLQWWTLSGGLRSFVMIANVLAAIVIGCLHFCTGRFSENKPHATPPNEDANAPIPKL